MNATEYHDLIRCCLKFRVRISGYYSVVSESSVITMLQVKFVNFKLKLTNNTLTRTPTVTVSTVAPGHASPMYGPSRRIRLSSPSPGPGPGPETQSDSEPARPEGPESFSGFRLTAVGLTRSQGLGR